MTTPIVRHKWSILPHLVAREFDQAIETYCGKWYPLSMTVRRNTDCWFCVCEKCRDRSAREKGMKFYATPALRKNRPIDARKLRKELRAINERRKFAAFTGHQPPQLELGE